MDILQKNKEALLEQAVENLTTIVESLDNLHQSLDGRMPAEAYKTIDLLRTSGISLRRSIESTSLDDTGDVYWTTTLVLINSLEAATLNLCRLYLPTS